ncbi:hypothetical protein OROGR_022836 [Orobanche gracilis]
MEIGVCLTLKERTDMDAHKERPKDAQKENRPNKDLRGDGIEDSNNRGYYYYKETREDDGTNKETTNELVKGLPHQQVPQPNDFSSQELEKL